METITVCKAQPTGDQVIPTVVLKIDGDIPSPKSDNWQEEYEHFYMAQAGLIMEALESLPQGTRHQLLIKLLQDKLCLFKGA